MIGLQKQGWLLVAMLGVTMAEVPWKPGKKSFWPMEVPKPEWWMAIRNSTDFDTDAELPEPPGGSGGWATAAEAVRSMGRGINLGNTFDMPAEYPDRLSFERNRRMIDLFAEKGFAHVRIPVTWGETFDPYSAFTGQVTMVVEYALSKGLWVVLNTHHEAWLKCCYDDSYFYNQKFSELWRGIASHFSGAGDHLMFEVLNEPEGAFGDWWHKSPPPNDAGGIWLTRKVCQVGIRAIRDVSANRVIFCAPNAQGNVHQAGAVFESKDDFGGLYDERVAVTLHTYDPWDFCGEDGRNSFWGAWAMKNFYNEMLQTLRRWQWATGIPVHIGEYGVGRKQQWDRDSDMVRSFYRHVADKVTANGWAVTLWDDGGWYAIVSNFQFVYGLAAAALGHGPAPSPGPGPVPTVQRCCWGGCSQCTEDAWCNGNEHNCGVCGGGWCSVPATPLSQAAPRVAEGGAKDVKSHVQVGGEALAAQKRHARSLRASTEADAAAMLQGVRKRHKIFGEGQRRGVVSFAESSIVSGGAHGGVEL